MPGIQILTAFWTPERDKPLTMEEISDEALDYHYQKMAGETLDQSEKSAIKYLLTKVAQCIYVTHLFVFNRSLHPARLVDDAAWVMSKPGKWDKVRILTECENWEVDNITSALLNYAIPITDIIKRESFSMLSTEDDVIRQEEEENEVAAVDLKPVISHEEDNYPLMFPYDPAKTCTISEQEIAPDQEASKPVTEKIETFVSITHDGVSVEQIGNEITVVWPDGATVSFVDGALASVSMAGNSV